MTTPTKKPVKAWAIKRRKSFESVIGKTEKQAWDFLCNSGMGTCPHHIENLKRDGFKAVRVTIQEL